MATLFEKGKKREEFTFLSFLYPKPGSNRYGPFGPQDFKSGVSTYSTIRATCFASSAGQKYKFNLVFATFYVVNNFRIGIGVEPNHLRIASEPGELAFGIAT